MHFLFHWKGLFFVQQFFKQGYIYSLANLYMIPYITLGMWKHAHFESRETVEQAPLSCTPSHPLSCIQRLTVQWRRLYPLTTPIPCKQFGCWMCKIFMSLQLLPLGGIFCTFCWVLLCTKGLSGDASFWGLHLNGDASFWGLYPVQNRCCMLSWLWHVAAVETLSHFVPLNPWWTGCLM